MSNYNRLYYSNFCNHSKNVLDFMKRNNLLNSIDFLCVDNRFQDSKTNTLYIILNNGKTKEPLPPNIQEVPALLLVKEGYRVILGKDIINYYAPSQQNVFNEIKTNEPMPTSIDDAGGQFKTYSQVDKPTVGNIPTPYENFQTNKIGEEITVELIEQKRNNEFNIMTEELRQKNDLLRS